MTSRTNYYKTVSQVYRHIDTDNNISRFVHPYDEKNEHMQKMIEEIAQRNNEIETQSNEDLLHFDNSEIRMNTNISAQLNVPIENTIEEPENYSHENYGHEKTQSRNAYAMGGDAKPSMREKKFGKRREAKTRDATPFAKCEQARDAKAIQGPALEICVSASA